MLPLNCTNLMYKTQVNFSVLNGHVEELVEKGLLIRKAVGERFVYRTSSAGYDVLKQWRQLSAVVGA
jgi:predicted transcriptional regulator